MTVAISKSIRAALAAAGYRKADVSVYNKGYSLGSTVYVTVKRADVRLPDVETIATAHEDVTRDSTGQILGGGNCFVDVRYAPEALREQASIINAQVAAGRVRFGSHELHEKDPFTWQVWVGNGDGTARAGMHLDRKEPGDGLARMLASAGELWTLLDTEAAAEMPAPANDDAAAEPPPASKLTAKESIVLAALRDHVEGYEDTTEEWGSVYIDNAKPDDMTGRSFAGVLAALEGKGLYRSQGDDAFGYVRTLPPCSVCGSRKDHTGLVCVARPESAPRFIATDRRAPPFALVDASDADSAAVRGAILVLESAVESGRMPPRAALEALAHMCFGMGREQR